MDALEILPACAQTPLADAPFARWRTEDGEVAATFHHRAEGYAIRFNERADFAVSLGGAAVTCVPVPGVSEHSLRDLFLNQVVPLIRGMEGDLVIHASAVALDGGAVAFAGQTGRGKSTLAAAFASASMPFLADDGVTLVRDGERYLVTPNRPSLRLWHDSQCAVGARLAEPDEDEMEKSTVAAGERLPFQSEPLPLRAFYFLGRGESEEIRIAPLSPQRSLAELINHAFLLDVADRDLLRNHFDALADLASRAACFSLDYPRDYALLPDVIAAVKRHGALREPTA